MRQQSQFCGFEVPFVSGVELGVCITSPSSAAADVAEWLGEGIEAIHQLDGLIGSEIHNKADARGLTNFVAAASSLLTLTSTLGRQLGLCRGVVDALIPHLPDIREPETAPPLRRAVGLFSSQREWRRLVDAFDDAEADDETGVPDSQRGLAAAEALEALIDFPAPDIQAFHEKLRIVETTDTIANKEFFTALVRDAANLAQPATPIPEPSPAPRLTHRTVSIWLEMLKSGRLTGLEEMMAEARHALLPHGQLTETEEV